MLCRRQALCLIHFKASGVLDGASHLIHRKHQPHMTTAFPMRMDTPPSQQAIVQSTRACPLCRESSGTDVATHVGFGEKSLHECTRTIVQILYPEWRAEDGSCSSCWRFYSNLIKILNVSGSFDSRFCIGDRSDRANGEHPEKVSEEKYCEKLRLPSGRLDSHCSHP